MGRAIANLHNAAIVEGSDELTDEESFQAVKTIVVELKRGTIATERRWAIAS